MSIELNFDGFFEQLSRDPTTATPAPQAPIARLVVAENGSASATLYAPGLPEGTYDLYLDAYSLSDKATRGLLDAAIKTAAELAKRKPLAALSHLSELPIIGRRQFSAAFDLADEDTRLMAIALCDAIDKAKNEGHYTINEDEC